MKDAGVLPGIRVDKGTVELDGTNGETITQGLDGLAVRCKRYYNAGVRFAKWRMVLKIGPNEPFELAIKENVISVGRYAMICQKNGLLPLIEPQICVHGNHDIKMCAAVTQRALRACLKALEDRNVDLKRTIWKLSMVIPGSESDKVALSHGVAAEHTIHALQQTLPLAVPGVIFLGGCQTEEEATINLNAINQRKGKSPWTLSFSFGRALQHSALRAWLGKAENVQKAREVFVTRCKANSQASLG
ncbi:fructose-bisphosphate aldolase 6, cytosolic, partial [Tanacetum coccineum]